MASIMANYAEKNGKGGDVSVVISTISGNFCNVPESFIGIFQGSLPVHMALYLGHFRVNQGR